jgi:hypothetical protein
MRFFKHRFSFQNAVSEEDRDIVECPKTIALFLMIIICVTLDVIGGNLTGQLKIYVY